MKYIFVTLVLFGLLQANLKNVQTFEANFTQTVTNPSGSKIQYEGKVFFKNPALILWHYDDPKKDVLIQSSSVTIIEPDLEQVIVTKLQKQINLITLLNEAKQIGKTQYISTIYDTQYLLTIKNEQLESIFYKDQLENQVSIFFSHQKINEEILNSIFDLKIPDEFDIIRK
ncbi:MAG: outer-membrane lipoprotein carrier protein LolA [Campylobacterales bacterium]|nr:outer-membrane lipoprotein carrier protein LolA [Campylobacterales bacterium]